MYRDQDFVVPCPESVRAIVEIKGMLDQKQIGDAVDQFIGCARKWKRSGEFYRANYLLP
jgi:hypothetical protein